MSFVDLDQGFFTNQLNADAAALMPRVKKAFVDLKEGSCPGDDLLGWYHYPRNGGYEALDEIQRYCNRVSGDYDLVVVIGIGGSYLGTRAVSEAFSHRFAGQVPPKKYGEYKQIVFSGYHLCETDLVELMDLLDCHQPLLVVVSKSGYSAEPAIAFRILRRYMTDRYGHSGFRDRTVVVTGDTGALKQIAEDEGLERFTVPKDIGGRYSILTPVGLLPLALAGFDVRSLLRGGELVFDELDRVYANPESTHAALEYAACRMAAYQAGKQVELLAYSQPKLRTFVEWWKQLFGESEGKQGKGLFPAGMAYTTDLHSLGQMIQSGTRSFLETFVVFEDLYPERLLERRLKVPAMPDDLDQLSYIEGRHINDINGSAEQGTKVAHFDGGVPCLQIKVRSYNEKGLGALFAFFEASCAVSSLVLGVNPFDQPGVENYKNNLFGLLGKPGFEQLGQHLRQRMQQLGPTYS